MRVSPRRTLTFLLTVCMTVILYLNVLSFLEHQQRVVSLYSLQGGAPVAEELLDSAYPGRYVILAGEVLRVNSERYQELVSQRQRSASVWAAGGGGGAGVGGGGIGGTHLVAGIRTVRLHAGLDTTRILLDAKEGVRHKGVWPPDVAAPASDAAAAASAVNGGNSQLNFKDIRSPPRRYKGKRRSIWPNPEFPYDDRILDQILYVPESLNRKHGQRRKPDVSGVVRSVNGGAHRLNYLRNRTHPSGNRNKVKTNGDTNNNNDDDGDNQLTSLKTILMWSGLGDLKTGQSRFLEDKCPIDTCYVTENAAVADRADAVVFNFDPVYYTWTRPPQQIWILWMLESPIHTATLRDMKDQVNWTATYRGDSTIVTPYEKFIPYKDTPLPELPTRNYSDGKTKQVAWFVSNCGARNMRLEFAEELGKHIGVDIYGGCGTHKCSRLDQDACLDILRRDYKFYLAFENSNCDYYITEKFFWNGLKADVIPIVMGARKEDYLAAAPPFSYIHVEDFSSPRDLAEYLTKLDRNATLYNSYFRWRTMGEFINTKFWCRLCSMLHDDNIPLHNYPSIEQWWRPNGTCTLDRWDNPADHINDWKKYVYSNL